MVQNACFPFKTSEFETILKWTTPMTMYRWNNRGRRRWSKHNDAKRENEKYKYERICYLHDSFDNCYHVQCLHDEIMF